MYEMFRHWEVTWKLLFTLLRVPQQREVVQWSFCKFLLPSKLLFSLHPHNQFLSLLCNPDFIALPSPCIWCHLHLIPVHPKREVFPPSISWARVSRGPQAGVGLRARAAAWERVAQWCCSKAGSTGLLWTAGSDHCMHTELGICTSS